jgi:hypothetical protein
LFFVNNQCIDSSEFQGLIYVNGHHTFENCVLLANTDKSGKVIGFGPSGSLTCSNWLIDEVLTASGGGSIQTLGTGTVVQSNMTIPPDCPFVISTPTTLPVPTAPPLLTSSRLRPTPVPKSSILRITPVFASSGHFTASPVWSLSPPFASTVHLAVTATLGTFTVSAGFSLSQPLGGSRTIDPSTPFAGSQKLAASRPVRESLRPQTSDVFRSHKLAPSGTWWPSAALGLSRRLAASKALAGSENVGRSDVLELSAVWHSRGTAASAAHFSSLPPVASRGIAVSVRLHEFENLRLSEALTGSMTVPLSTALRSAVLPASDWVCASIVDGASDAQRQTFEVNATDLVPPAQLPNAALVPTLDPLSSGHFATSHRLQLEWMHESRGLRATRFVSGPRLAGSNVFETPGNSQFKGVTSTWMLSVIIVAPLLLLVGIVVFIIYRFRVTIEYEEVTIPTDEPEDDDNPLGAALITMNSIAHWFENPDEDNPEAIIESMTHELNDELNDEVTDITVGQSLEDGIHIE